MEQCLILVGCPRRWQLPEDAAPLHRVASMYHHMHEMYEMQSLYTVLQGFVLLMVIVRLLNYVGFQSRLAVISGTLARATPDLVHFSIVIMITGLTFCAMVGTVFGARVQQMSTIEFSLQALMSLLILGDDGGALGEVTDASVVMTSVENAVAAIVCGFGPIFFLFVLQSFLMGFLAWPYYELMTVAKGGAGIITLLPVHS